MRWSTLAKSWQFNDRRQYIGSPTLATKLKQSKKARKAKKGEKRIEGKKEDEQTVEQIRVGT
jgi:hypothetical protein